MARAAQMEPIGWCDLLTMNGRLLAFGAAAAFALILGMGCAGPTGGASVSPQASTGTSGPDWQEPEAYTYAFEASRGERSLIGRFEVTVEDRTVVDYRALDPAAAAFPGTSADLPTLGELFERVDQAQKDDDAVVTFETDPLDGHPTRIEIDWLPNAIDDEECYVIESYMPTD